LLFWGGIQTEWKITETGIFHSITPDWVCLGEHSELYILDFRGAEILHFDAGGRLQGKIGRRGQGPGEFQFITAIHFLEGRLFGFDSTRRLVQVFDAQGVYKQTYQAPHAAVFLGTTAKPAGSGWAYVDQDAGTLIRCDRDFGNPRVIARVADEFILEQTPDRRIFHPAPDIILMDTDSRGDEIFVYLPGQGFTVFRFDGETGMRLGKIEVDGKRLPFDRGWGEERFETFLAGIKGKPYIRAQEFEARFPKYFPAIAALTFDLRGYLRIRYGNPNLAPEKANLVLNMEGKAIQDTLPGATFRKIVAHDEDWVYLANYGSAGVTDDELTITRLSRSEFPENF
jgi:hypothetical protein